MRKPYYVDGGGIYDSREPSGRGALPILVQGEHGTITLLDKVAELLNREEELKK
jgi:hypothetical protein